MRVPRIRQFLTDEDASAKCRWVRCQKELFLFQTLRSTRRNAGGWRVQEWDQAGTVARAGLTMHAVPLLKKSLAYGLHGPNFSGMPTYAWTAQSIIFQNPENIQSIRPATFPSQPLHGLTQIYKYNHENIAFCTNLTSLLPTECLPFMTSRMIQGSGCMLHDHWEAHLDSRSLKVSTNQVKSPSSFLQ